MVEDNPPTVVAVSLRIKQMFRESVIDAADNVADAEQKVGDSVAAHMPYDVAILDFMLPADSSDPTEVPSRALGFRVREMSPGTLIVHITAHADEEEFQSFLRYKKASADYGRLCVLKDSGWITSLINGVHRAFIPYQVRIRFDALFRRRREAAWFRASSNRWEEVRSDRSRSLEIACLCADASKYWSVLSPKLQEEIDSVLGHAEDKHGNHFVGVASESNARGKVKKGSGV